MENEIIYIKLDDIIPNRFQPREVFDTKALNELAESIRQHGVIQPITVRPVDNKYEIIAGERRYKASALAGLTKIPCIVRNLNDKESSILAYIENAHRKDVSPIEEARTSERILKTNNMTQEELARELGISQSSLANKLRLLTLPLEIQESLMKNEISERHARSLLSVKEPAKQIELLNKVKTNKMTVRDLDGEIRNMYGNNNVNESINNNNNNSNFYDINNTPNNNQFMPNDNNTGSFNNQFIQDMDNNINNNFNSSNTMFNQPISTFNNESLPSNNPYTENSNNYEKPFVFTEQNNFPTNNAIDNQNTSFNSNINDVDSNFTSFLNNFDESKYNFNELTNNDINNNAPTNTNVDSDNSFMNFLNGFDESKYELNNGTNIASQSITPPPEVLNSPTPPIVNSPTPPNMAEYKYVEDNPNYLDIVNPKKIDTVDGVIAELQNAVNKIKDSNFKIDTDEINFDDMYQITIKIDKKGIF